MFRKAPRGERIHRDQVFIGGGGGEHPALMIDLNYCVGRLIRLYNMYSSEQIPDSKEMEAIYDRFKNYEMREGGLKYSHIYDYEVDMNTWGYESFARVDKWIDQRFKMIYGEDYNSHHQDNLALKIYLSVGLMALSEFPDIGLFCEDKELASIFRDFDNYQKSNPPIDEVKQYADMCSGLLNSQRAGSVQIAGKSVCGISLSSWYLREQISKLPSPSAYDIRLPHDSQ